MARARRTRVTPRKQPVQARSTQLVADILKAAVRVLEREGARRFTTIRVAKQAGVSVGSLYQYFPNKESILYRLQLDEWQQTGLLLDGLLGDASTPPAQRLRAMIRAFFRSERDEAPLRSALDAWAPTYHDAPEVSAQRQRSERIIARFVSEIAPHATPARRRFAGDLLMTTVSAVGKQVSERGLSDSELMRWADTIASLLVTHLTSL